jgi:hypothetical protein
MRSQASHGVNVLGMQHDSQLMRGTGQARQQKGPIPTTRRYRTHSLENEIRSSTCDGLLMLATACMGCGYIIYGVLRH